MENNVVGIRHDGIWIILFWGSGYQLLFQHLPWYTTSLSNKALLCEERRFFSITMSSFLENRQSWVLLLIGTSIVKGVTGFLLLASTIIILLIIVAWQNGLPCYERSRRRRENRINFVDVINIMTQNLIFVLMVLSLFLVCVWKELSSISIHKITTLTSSRCMIL